jgi:hypothetical protein
MPRWCHARGHPGALWSGRLAARVTASFGWLQSRQRPRAGAPPAATPTATEEPAPLNMNVELHRDPARPSGLRGRYKARRRHGDHLIPMGITMVSNRHRRRFRRWWTQPTERRQRPQLIDIGDKPARPPIRQNRPLSLTDSGGELITAGDASLTFGRFR